MPPILQVKNLSKSFGKKTPFLAVKGISFELKPKEILGLLGPNGSGKTTTIQMLLGTLTPSGGSIVYFGKSFDEHRADILHHVAFASTYASMPHVLTVEENLAWFGRMYGLKNSLEKADPLLKRFGIWDKLKTKVSALSAGQVTRLMIVKAFFIDPKIVLLDEPTASLDPDVAHEVCQFLLEQREKTGISILFTSHKMDEVAEVCDRVIVLKQGNIIADDLPKNLAKSISTYRLRLTITDGMKRTTKLAEANHLTFQVDHRTITLSVDEKMIPHFLQSLMQAGVTYASIQIEEPTLEDYFIKIAGIQ